MRVAVYALFHTCLITGAMRSTNDTTSWPTACQPARDIAPGKRDATLSPRHEAQGHGGRYEGRNLCTVQH
jgi:hypothetical protein